MPRQRGKRWQADVMVDGRRQRPSFVSKSQAEQFERDFVKVNTKVGVLLPSLAREIWGGTRDERNCLRIADELVRRIGPEQPITYINTVVVDNLAAELKKIGNKPRTVNTKLSRLSKMLKKARRKNLLDNIPLIELSPVKGGRIRFLTPKEEALIREHLDERYRMMFDFLLATGCRYSEAFKLKWEDLSEDEAKDEQTGEIVKITNVTFWERKHGNGTVPLVGDARNCIPWSRHNELIRPFADMIYESFYHAFVRAKKAAGFGDDKQLVVHTLRHTCASRLVQRGVDIYRVQEWLGHESIEMTMKYAHLAPKALYGAAMVLHKRR